MYIPEFICGAIAVVLAEIAGIIIYAICVGKKKRKKK